MALIKNGTVTEDAWRHLDEGEEAPAGDPITVSLERWKRDRASLGDRQGPLGVRLNPADPPEDLAPELDRFALIVLEMSPFTDGRVFSTARLLRERYGYQGELRVRGDFLRDQMLFLSRVGIDAFELAEGADPADLLRAFAEFSVAYQAPNDRVRPHRYRS